MWSPVAFRAIQPTELGAEGLLNDHNHVELSQPLWVRWESAIKATIAQSCELSTAAHELPGQIAQIVLWGAAGVVRVVVNLTASERPKKTTRSVGGQLVRDPICGERDRIAVEADGH